MFSNIPQDIKDKILALGLAKPCTYGPRSPAEILEGFSTAFAEDRPYDFITLNAASGKSIAFIGNTENSEAIALVIDMLWNSFVKELVKDEQA